MSRACDLGPGDVWGSPADEAYSCECGREFDDFENEPCRHDNCPECRDASSCCVECQTCHLFTDSDETEDDTCVDCAVAAMEREEARLESDLVALEAKGDEMRERAGGAF